MLQHLRAYCIGKTENYHIDFDSRYLFPIEIYTMITYIFNIHEEFLVAYDIEYV